MPPVPPAPTNAVPQAKALQVQLGQEAGEVRAGVARQLAAPEPALQLLQQPGLLRIALLGAQDLW